MRRGGGDAGRLDLSGEDRILALLAAAFSAPVNAVLLIKLRHASALWAQGDKSLAQIHLEHLRLPKLENGEQAFRLFLADQLIASGHSPCGLCKVLGFDLPKGLRKFSPDQARDDHGRWTSGGGDAGSAEGSSACPLFSIVCGCPEHRNNFRWLATANIFLYRRLFAYILFFK